MSRKLRVLAGLGTTSVTAGLLLAAACSPAPAPGAPDRGPTHAEYAEALADSPLRDAILARRWLDAAEAALSAPATLELPHQERGVFLPHEARAVGIAFVAVEEQRLKIDLDLSDDSSGRLFAELFVLEDTDRAEPRPVAAFTDLAGGVLPLPAAGRYVLRLQPELLARIDYNLRLQLAAALEFPVSRHDRGDIGGVYGDPRDGGRRRHEGIDIFAPRNTPVLAVADGVAVARSSRLGGHTVWLRGQARSYYYAHLERAAFSSRQSVRAGEVIGYVGNSGNAAATPPHLHFGIYRRGLGAVDPLPYIAERTWAVPPPVPAPVPGYSAVSAAALNLRRGPGSAYDVLDSLSVGTVLRVLGSTGDWLRVRTATREGWVHGDYQTTTLTPLEVSTVQTDTWLLERPNPTPSASARLRAGEQAHVFAVVPGWRLVGTTNAPLGWAPYGAVASARGVTSTAPGTPAN